MLLDICQYACGSLSATSCLMSSIILFVASLKPVMGRLCKIKNCPSFMHHSISWGLPAACSIFHATCAKATNWSSVGAGRALAGPAWTESARPALTDDQLVALAHVAWNIEQAAGRPQDIEWCMKEGQFFILQSRPIT